MTALDLRADVCDAPGTFARFHMRVLLAFAGAVLIIAACGGHDASGLFVPPAGDTADGGSTSGGSSGAASSGNGSSGASSSSTGGSTSGGSSSGSSTSSSGSSGCANQDATDHDGDGFSSKDGDCNDCDPGINPGAFDVPGNGKDDDCSGTADDDVACDGALALASTDPLDGAKALGLCKKTTSDAKTWGVLSARYILPDGTALSGHSEGLGLLDKFGANTPTSGARALGLSTGAARAPGQAGFVDPSGDDKGYTHAVPVGYTARTPAGCTTALGAPHDGVALELKIRVPTNAHSFAFNTNLFTYDFAQYVCTQFNDVFVVLQTPAPPGLADANIVFDAANGPVSVDSADLLQVCGPQTAGGKTFACPHGASALTGTSFETHAATDWLATRSPVTPGTTVTLLFATWDSGDGVLDTTVLVDGFAWSTNPVEKTVTAPK
jgi:hypothetical protein